MDELHAIDPPAEEVLRKEEQADLQEGHLLLAIEFSAIPTCQTRQEFFVYILYSLINRLFARMFCCNYFNQLHNRNGIHEMHANNLCWSIGVLGKPIN